MGIDITLPRFCRTKPMLTYELNYCFDMFFVRQNQGRTICIPILDTQSGQDGVYAIYKDGVLLKQACWTFIAVSFVIL